MYASPCVNFQAATFGGGVFKLFIDVMITTLPIPLILRLKLNSAQKYGVVVTLALGYVVCAAGAVRTYYTYIIFWRTTDIVWYEYPAFLALTVENDLGIVSYHRFRNFTDLANRYRYAPVCHSYDLYLVNMPIELLHQSDRLFATRRVVRMGKRLWRARRHLTKGHRPIQEAHT
jgi:hypothetical protein